MRREEGSVVGQSAESELFELKSVLQAKAGCLQCSCCVELCWAVVCCLMSSELSMCTCNNTVCVTLQ